MKLALSIAVVALIFLAARPSRADALDDAYAAYHAQDYVSAARLFRPLAEKGDADAETMLGYMYERGLGVLEDYHEAVRWYRLAARQGYGRGQTSLGYMFEFGLGVPKDNVRAHMWYNIAASQSGVTDARDAIAREMTQQQIAQAQEMARKCLASHYGECD